MICIWYFDALRLMIGIDAIVVGLLPLVCIDVEHGRRLKYGNEFNYLCELIIYDATL